MPPPRDGNEYLPFEKLIQLERLNKDSFRSIALPFAPDGPNGSRGAAYGGHVFMQAAWAACQTVGEGFLLSNVSGNFILPGIPDVRFTYTVMNIRDGRSVCTRIVNVHQKEGKGYMFTCTCVFKTAETSPLDAQAGIDIKEKYSLALENKHPAYFEECPGYDVPWYRREQTAGKPNDKFPGLDSRKVDMSAHNANKHPLDRRQLIFYRSLGTLPKDDLNMHLCAQLYASDRNSLFHVANAFEIGDKYSALGSLIHQVVFHTNAGDMHFGEDFGPRDERTRWFVKEDWTTRYSGGRGLFQSRVWSPEGRHVMSITQDGMVRVPGGKEGEVEKMKESWKGLREREVEDLGRREKL